MKKIKLMAEYECFPLWFNSFNSDDEMGDIDPDTLPISEPLKEELLKWANELNVTLNQDYPPWSRFPGKEAEDAFTKKGAWLRDQLQKELGSGYEVTYDAYHPQYP